MKAITIRQPHAQLIALGVKTIETRSWKTNYRGPIAIHAGLAKPICEQREGSVPFDEIGDFQFGGNEEDQHWWIHCLDAYSSWADVILQPLPFGAVIATGELVDCLPIARANAEPTEEDGHQLEIHSDCVFETYWGSATAEFEGQLPYGDFTPGRYGWMLDNIKPITPVPAKGRLGFWQWDGA